MLPKGSEVSQFALEMTAVLRLNLAPGSREEAGNTRKLGDDCSNFYCSLLQLISNSLVNNLFKVLTLGGIMRIPTENLLIYCI